MSEPTPAPPKKANVNWSAIAPALAFLVIVGIGVVVFINQQSQVRKAEEKQRQEILALGLPDEFPLEDIPLYPGLKISEKKRDDAESTEGKPMDLWEVRGTTPDDKKQVFDFYKEKLLAHGMGQTQYISIPTGLGVTYADEQYSVEFEIERQPEAKESTVVIRAHRLKK